MRVNRLPLATAACALLAGLALAAPDARAGRNEGILQLETATAFEFGVIDTIGFTLESGMGWGRWEVRTNVGWFDYSDSDRSDLGLDTTRLGALLRYNVLQKVFDDGARFGIRFANWIEAGVARKSVALYRQVAYDRNVIEDGTRAELTGGFGIGVFMRAGIGMSLTTRWNTAPATRAEEMLLGGGPVNSYSVLVGFSFNAL